MAKIKNTKSNRRFNTILLIGIVFSSLTTFGLVNNPNNNQDIRSHASVEDDAVACVKAPACCDEIVKTGDAHACPDPWGVEGRGYCPLSVCGAIEGKKERCGWYWIWHNKDDNDYKIGTNAPDGYGCMIGDSESTMRPKYGPGGATNPPPQPTQPPPTATIYLPPTSIPTAVPTVFIPTSFPTQVPSYPTSIPTVPSNPTGNIMPTVYLPPTLYIYPTVTSEPSYTPTPTPKLFSLPNILPPKEKVMTFLDTLKTKIGKFLSMILP